MATNGQMSPKSDSVAPLAESGQEDREDCNGRVGITGFCFGAAPLDEVGKIRAAMLVQHGELDKRLVDAWPDYEKALRAAGVTYEGHVHPGAGHGFFNDATPERYVDAAATAAWQRTLAWFNEHVRR